MLFFSCFILLLHFFENVSSAKLLLTVMDQGKSHASSILPLIHRLQKDNHTTALEMNSYAPAGMDFRVEERFINMTGFQNRFASKDFYKVAFNEEFTFLHGAIPYIFGSFSCNEVLQNRRERFFEIANEDWDMFLTDSLFSTCGYGMAYLSGKPHVMMHSSDVESGHGTFKGFSKNYALMVPNFLPYSLPDFTVEKYWHRVVSTIDWFGYTFTTAVLADISQKWALRSIIGFPYFSFYNFSRTSTFSFTDMPEALYPVGPKTNDLFSFGAYCKSGDQKLDEEFAEFVNDPSSKGTILIAFGTIIDWRFAPKEKLETFINVMNKLTEYRVIWSMKGERPPALGEHVKTSSWIPQNQLLHHEKTLVFLSHGGLKSVKEATCSATPSIFMPMFAEQMRNAWLAKSKGFAKILNKFLLTEELLEHHIREVIKDASYQKNADKVVSTFLDHPIPNLDEAAFKFNKLWKYKGKMPEYFYPKAIQLSYFTSLNLDAFVFIPFAFLFVISK